MIEDVEEIQRLSRAERQARVARWCADAFGADSLYDRRKRALRLLEEALELFQAEGGSADQATALALRVFSRSPGTPALEAGGVALTLLSYCEAAGISVDRCEAAEIARIFAKPVEEARARYQAKVDAGF